MLYAMLAYHEEGHVQSWTEDADAELMADLNAIHARQDAAGQLGPAARLGATARAVTIRAGGLVVDGPFAETKEALLGLYVLDVADQDEAVAEARALQAINPSAVYEIRPIVVFRPGKTIPHSDFGLADVRPAGT
jgi:hypothetical protein